MVGLRAFSGIAFSVISVTALGQESQKANELKRPDVQADAPVVIFRGHDDEVTFLSFSADGNQVVSASAKAVSIWDPATGKEIRRLKVDDRSTVGIITTSVDWPSRDRSILVAPLSRSME